MFETACEKYRALAKLLIDNGISCDIYPQGSFATGTVVRPIKDYKEADYDLDVICKVNSEKSNTNPGDLKKRIGEIITNCKRYQLPLEEFNTCWTITFSEANGIRFKLDVVPSVSEDEDTIKRLRSQADKSCKEFVDDSVAISMKKNSCYKWSTSNPLGYKDWFDRINKLYPIYSTEQLEPIVEKSSVRVSTVEEIPPDEDRTSLQIAIQILKRCRDVYFSNYDENCKPISAIITTLAATIAENAPEITKNYDPFEMLTYILAELEGYSELRFLNESCGTFAAKTLIKKQNGEWRLSNPVMNDFSTKQNANDMLMLQFAARQHYNRAERLNYFYLILCILDIVLVYVYETILQEPLIAGLISGSIFFLLMFVVSKQVERNINIAAGMRQLFDYKLFGFCLPNSFQGYTQESLITFVFLEKRRNVTKFIQQINNDGHSKKPGVKNWYNSVTDDMTLVEAIRTCQNENRFFDNILTKITQAGFILILMMVVFLLFC